MTGTGPFTLPETVLLIGLPDDGREPRNPLPLYSDVVQAHLVDLGLQGALRVEGDNVIPVPGREPTAPGLRIAYEKLARKDSWSLKTDIHFNRLMPNAREVARGLVDRGVLQEVRTKRFGIVPVPIFPATDLAARHAMRERIGSVLRGSSEPQGFDAALLLLIADDLIKDQDKDRESEAKERASDIIADASPEGSFLRGYAAARAKDFWRTSSSLRDLFPF